MAFKNKDTKEKKFSFEHKARIFFAKEMAGFNFDFDAFLKSKQALFSNKKGFLVSTWLESESEQADYRRKFIEKTPYYNFDLVEVEKFFSVPLQVWQELRTQSQVEENYEWWAKTNAQDLATGSPHNVRARLKIREMWESTNKTAKIMTMPKYDFDEYGAKSFKLE